MKIIILLVFAVASSFAQNPRPHAPCRIVYGQPDPKCTPGHVELTDAHKACTIPTYTRRKVSWETKRYVMRRYGFYDRYPANTLEIDHLIPLGIGGSNDVRNLWPQFGRSNYLMKDRAEVIARRLVCTGVLPIEVAQKRMVENWRGFLK